MAAPVAVELFDKRTKTVVERVPVTTWKEANWVEAEMEQRALPGQIVQTEVDDARL